MGDLVIVVITATLAGGGLLTMVIVKGQHFSCQQLRDSPRTTVNATVNMDGTMLLLGPRELRKISAVATVFLFRRSLASTCLWATS